MSTDCEVPPQVGRDPVDRPDVWAGWLRLAGLGSLGVAVLYALGFLVHLGHSYLLGLFPGALTALDALRFAGGFLFQCLHALVHAVLNPTAAPWPGTVGLGVYLAWAVALLTADGLLVASRVRVCQKGRPARRQLWRAGRALVTIGLAVFTICWLALLTRPFMYHDMLFPVGTSSYDQRFAKYNADIAAFDTWGTTGEQQRRDRQKALLRSALLDEYDAALVQGDTSQPDRLKEFAAWLRRSPPEKNTTLGVLLLTATASVLLLISTALRQFPVHVAGASVSHRLRREAVRTVLVLAILFQVSTIPFDFGILLVERQVPRARVRADGFEGLERHEILLLGYDDHYRYFYSPLDFWTVYAVPDASIQEIRLVGKAPIFSWMVEIVPEP